jgi:parvulin-like peptidyl-prolyl isomerase
MVMTALRDRIKIVIFVTLAAFVGLIFFDWGMQQSGGGGGPQGGGILGTVNGEEITDTLYRRTRQSLLDELEQRTGRPAEVSDLDTLEDDVWLTIVRELLLRGQVEKYGIRVTDAEILELLRTSPPEFVRGIPNFLDEQGQFDPVRYSQALANPAFEGLWLQVETLIRASAPTDKLQNFVGLAARTTSAEVHQRFVDRNEKVRARFVVSSPAQIEVDESSLEDAAVRAWYDAHREEFRTGRQAVLEYVRVSKTPTGPDSSDTRLDLDNIRKAIVDGADFAEEAKDWSDDSSSERGGDLGFFSRGDMVPEFEEVAFSLDPGEMSPVFLSPFGYHLVKVEEKRKENGADQVRARHILLRIEPSRETLRDAEDRIDGFLAAVEEGAAFEAAAGQAGLEVQTTPAFERGDFIAGIGLVRPAHRFAFAAAAGEVSTSPVEDEDALYAFRLASTRPAGIAAFEEVADRARFGLAEERRREGARAAMEQAVAQGDGSIGSVARALGAEPDTTGEFARESFVPGVGRRDAFVAAAFRLPVGQVSGIIESDRGFYVLEVLEKTPADEAAFVEQRDQIRGQLILEKRQEAILGWMEQLLRDAEIVDYRSGTARDWTPETDGFLYARGDEA